MRNSTSNVTFWPDLEPYNFYVQGDPNQKLLIQMAISSQISISNNIGKVKMCLGGVH